MKKSELCFTICDKNLNRETILVGNNLFVPEELLINVIGRKNLKNVVKKQEVLWGRVL